MTRRSFLGLLAGATGILGGVASMAERPAVNRGVAGSTPAAVSYKFDIDPNPLRFRLEGRPPRYVRIDLFDGSHVLRPNAAWITSKTL